MLAFEVGGRWSAEATQFLRHLAYTNTETTHPGAASIEMVLSIRGCRYRDRFAHPGAAGIEMVSKGLAAEKDAGKTKKKRKEKCT